MKLQEKQRATITGVWHNQHNSEAHFTVADDGKIAGTFVTGVGGNNEASEEFPLTGFASGSMVAFSVNFTKYGCMSSWVGHISDDGGREFTAMWHMVAANPAHPEPLWKSVWTGQDTFKAGARKSERSEAKTPASHPMYCDII